MWMLKDHAATKHFAC